MPELFIIKLESGASIWLYANAKADAILSAQELYPGDKILLISKEGEW
jgi:hypothetical protein